MTEPDLVVSAPARTVVQVGELALGLSPGEVPDQLPSRTPGFTGRHRELAAVVAAAVGGVPAVLLTGRPGAGKTALAVQAAHAVRARYPGGRVVLSLHGHDGARPPTGHELAGRVLRALGTPDRDVPSDRGLRLAAYRALTGEHAVLVVADDAAGPAQVRPLRPGPGSLLLVTARARLDVGATTVTVDRLDDDEAAEIVRSGLAAGRAGAADDPDDPDDERGVARLVRACAGLPLALRISAARLALDPAATPAGLARDLRPDRDALDVLRAGDRAVRRSFQASYDRLDDRARRAFRRCAVLPLTYLDTGPVAALTGAGERDAAAALATLAERHLLDGTGPYRMHDLVRLFARERLRAEETPGDVAAAAERLVAGHLHALTAAVGDAARRDRLHAGHDVTTVVAEHLVATGDDRLQTLADAVCGAGEPLLAWDAWSRIQRAAIRDADRRDRPLRVADLRARTSIALRERGRLPQALRELAGVRRAYLDAGDPASAGGVIGNEAEIHRELGDDDRAAALFRAAIAMLDGTPSAEAGISLAWARHGLGDVLTGRGDADGALAQHGLALAGFREHGVPFGEAWAWHGTGDAERLRGRADAAVAAYRRALALHERVGSRTATGWTEQNLAEVLAGTGHRDEAARGFERALAAAELRGDPASRARALAGLAAVRDPDA